MKNLAVTILRTLCPPLFSLLTFILALTNAFAAEPSGTMANEKTIRELVGAMLLVGFRGTSIDESSIIVRDLRDYHVGGVILFDYDGEKKTYDRNFQSAAQLKSLIQQLKSYSREPLFIGVDQEGGAVERLKPRWGFPAFLGAKELGEAEETTPGSIYKSSLSMGAVLREVGFNLNFAPDVDVNVNPQNPVIARHGRSYSANPDKVAHDAEEFIRGQRENAVLTSIKHFPGHGSSLTDSHLGFTDISSTWEPSELTPFQVLIQRGQADMVMVGHLFYKPWDATYPTSLSSEIINGILRGKNPRSGLNLNFDGVVITDDLQMRAIGDHFTLEETVVHAINAGVDILLFGNTLVYDPEIVPKVQAIVLKAVEDGQISLHTLELANLRISRLRNRLKP